MTSPASMTRTESENERSSKRAAKTYSAVPPSTMLKQ